MSYKERSMKNDPLEYEGELYSAIATLDRLATDFADGNIDDTFYRKQLQALIREAYKARISLEREGNFQMEEFIKKNQLEEKFPRGIEKLKLAEGKGTVVIPYQELRRIPRKAADFVATSINLLDHLSLKSVAKIEYIVPMLDELYRILESFPGVDPNYWVLEEINSWRVILSQEEPSKLLPDSDIEKLAFQAERWLGEFRGLVSKLAD